MLGSILTGMTLGLVLLLLLSAYPGEPFDYSKPDGGRAEREAAVAGKSKKEEEEEEEEVEKVEVRVAADGCGSTMGSSSSSGSINSTITTTTTTTSVRHRRNHSKSDPSTRGRNGSRSSSSGNDEHDGHDGQHARAEALHRLLVQEDRVWQRLCHLPPAVRGMLGLSEDEVRLAVRQQQGGGNAGAATFVDHGRLSSRIDFIFYLLAFSALIYVITMEYGHVATRLFTRFFPKEAAVLGV